MRKKEKYRERKGKRKQERGKVEQPQRARKGVFVGGDWLPPWIRRCPAMSSWLSLCAGVEVPARTGSGSKAARRRERELRGAGAVLL